MEKLKLTNETIDILAEKIEELYSSNGATRKETMRARLILEEALLKYQSRFGEDIELYYRSYKIFSQRRFTVRILAASFDPFSLEENPMGFMIQSILSGFEGSMPTWKYRNLENELVFTIVKKKAHGDLFRIAVSIAASTALGLLARLLLPQEGLTAFVNNYLEPLSNAYAGLFCVMAVLLTLFAITLTIVHVGDVATIGALGGRILRRFFIMTPLLIGVLTLPLLPMFKISGGGTVSIAAKSLYDILIGFIPDNLVSPFLNFNSMHIMIIGAMFGFSLLSMGQRGETVVNLFDECNMVAVLTNSFLTRFINIYVGMKIFAIITLSEFSAIRGTAKMVVAIVLGEIVLFLFYGLYAWRKSKKPLSEFLKIMMPTFFVSLSTANVGAVFVLVFDKLAEMGADPDTTSLSLNLGSIIFQPGCTLMFMFSSLFMAAQYNVEISVTWIILAFFLSIVLVASVPNIPGATVSVLTLLYAQLGIPNEALALMIALNAVLQFITVAIDVWCLQCEVICFSADSEKA